MNQLDSAWKIFLRPPRAEYTPFDLGPPCFAAGDTIIRRTDFEVPNATAELLQCSVFAPAHSIPPTCLVYLHSFNGCRLEALPASAIAAKLGIALCTFDFSGCGVSGGELVTLGYKEKDDAAIILSFLKATYHFDSFILWGRSMGATTALLYLLHYQANFVKAIVLDSPFHDLEVLSQRMAAKKLKVPKLIAKGMIKFIKSQVENRGKFKFTDLKLPDSIQLDQKMLLLGSISDSIVPFKEIQKIYQGYKGEKQLLHLDSDHSDNRSEFVLEQVSRWIQTILFHDIVDKEQFQKERPQFSQSEKKSIRDSTVNESRMGMSLDYDEDQNIGQEGKLTPLKGDIGKVDSASQCMAFNSCYWFPRFQSADFGRIQNQRKNYQELHARGSLFLLLGQAQLHIKNRVSPSAYFIPSVEGIKQKYSYLMEKYSQKTLAPAETRRKSPLNAVPKFAPMADNHEVMYTQSQHRTRKRIFDQIYI